MRNSVVLQKRDLLFNFLKRRGAKTWFLEILEIFFISNEWGSRFNENNLKDKNVAKKKTRVNIFLSDFYFKRFVET